MIKNKVLKILLFSVIFIFVFVLGSKIIIDNRNYNINVKYVDEINSKLYDLVTVYNYNDITKRYDITEMTVKKDEFLYSIFNYYNKDLKYKLNSIFKEEDIITINLEDGDNEIDLYLIRIMKLSYSYVNVNKIIINYNDKQYVI